MGKGNLLPLLLLLGGLNITTAETQGRWTLIRNPPWPILVTMGEELPPVMVCGNVSPWLKQELQISSTGGNSTSVQLNFTGLSTGPPFCMTTGDSSSCMKVSNQTFEHWFKQGKETIHMMSLQNHGCPKDFTLQTGMVLQCPLVHASWGPLPPMLHCHTSHRTCNNDTDLILQSWHLHDNETQIVLPTWVTPKGQTTQYHLMAMALGYIVVTTPRSQGLWGPNYTADWWDSWEGRFGYLATARVCLKGGDHAFMWGRVENVNIIMNATIYNVTCVNCTVSECLGPKGNNQTIMIVKKTSLAATPIQTPGWYDSRGDHVIEKIRE